MVFNRVRGRLMVSFVPFVGQPPIMYISEFGLCLPRGQESSGVNGRFCSMPCSLQRAIVLAERSACLGT